MNNAFQINKKTTELSATAFQDIDFQSLIEAGKPVLIRGALDNPPLIAAAKSSRQAAYDYLLSEGQTGPLLEFIAEQGVDGRFFYNQEVNGFNFKADFVSLESFFLQLEDSLQAADGRALYLGSADIGKNFPHMLQANGMTLNSGVFEQFSTRAGIWIGNQTTAATHFDVSNNIAVCMAGRRRFTLFPPEQIQNLYPGPLDPTPGGQVVSMFNPNKPNFERFPNAKSAIDAAEVAELEPGDVLVYPAMWWHQVEALADFNVMINFWWNQVPAHIDDPMSLLMHGMLSLRDRPDHEKKAWRNLFDYYVFGDAETPREHLPEHAQGALAPMDESNARRLRLQILKKINR